MLGLGLKFGRGLGSGSGQTSRISDIKACPYHESQCGVKSWDDRGKKPLSIVVRWRRRGAPGTI